LVDYFNNCNEKDYNKVKKEMDKLTKIREQGDDSGAMALDKFKDKMKK
jgi:hypothetical protein